jgi:Xaa-Pro aminopeptidase
MSRLDQGIFAARRQQLVAQMGANAVAIIATREELFRNRDSDYKYRADSSFYYLTGFAEPEAVAVIETDAVGDYCYSLFCRPRDRSKEIWTGFRAGVEGALAEYGADQAFEIDRLEPEMLNLLQDKTRLWVRFGHNRSFDLRIRDWCQLQQQQSGGAALAIMPLDALLNEMRLIKSAAEIECMQQAAKISAEAHMRAMQRVRPGMMEYQLDAEIQYLFAQYGCQPAYNSIVGGGANACILHYVENDQPLQSGDLVLIDAGCEYQYYAGDISRTFPVNGRFSAEQRALYTLVLDAQEAAIAATQVGQPYRVPHQVACQRLTEGLLDLGLLSGDLSELIEQEAYLKFYMHGTGHWLGMDVHDVGAYKIDGQHRNYQAGMVVTVEPGLYVHADDQSVEPRWRGIGIRIEDDILVTAAGPQVLSADAIKQVADIEHWMQQHSLLSGG